MIKTQEFVSTLAMDIWRELHEPHIAILQVQYPTDTFAYEVSARLPLPKMVVTYLEFSKE